MLFKIKEKSLDEQGGLIIGGIAATSDLDEQGERNFITKKTLEEAMVDFRKKGSPVRVKHGKDQFYRSKDVGEVLVMEYVGEEFDINDPNAKMAIKTVCRITDPDAIRDIQSGYFTGFSLRWLYNSTRTLKNDTLSAD